MLTKNTILEALGILKLSKDFGKGGVGVIPGVFDGKEWKQGTTATSGKYHSALNPSTGEEIAKVSFGTIEDYERCMKNMMAAQKEWQNTPMPKRGEVVRVLGNLLREKQHALGALISMEMGKIKGEGVGEVVEFVDMCDLAVGMSRQIPGQLIPSERKSHAMIETWNPIGALGLITAFNFPCAVFGWNACINLICGNTQFTKGAESGSLVTIATQIILTEALTKCSINPAVAVLCQGTGQEIGQRMVDDKRLPLISFTGSTAVGRKIGSAVANRLGRSILELGGNNAITVLPDADLDMAVRSVLFAAVGTCGQRCTSLRRLILHEDIYDDFLHRLVNAYKGLVPGNPLQDGVLLGPLHNSRAERTFYDSIKEAIQQGGKLRCGGESKEQMKLDESISKGNFVKPAIIEIDLEKAHIVREERFVPILYVGKCTSFEHAVAINNSVDQGLTAAIFTRDMRNVFQWIGPHGSDTGISNVNTSCSGAEIGGAFGGNKDTGGGRESGSDSWKQYMRRGTCTINYGNELPLAQGISFSKQQQK